MKVYTEPTMNQMRLKMPTRDWSQVTTASCMNMTRLFIFFLTVASRARNPRKPRKLDTIVMEPETSKGKSWNNICHFPIFHNNTLLVVLHH